MSAEIGVPWRNLGHEISSNSNYTNSNINQPRPPSSTSPNNNNNNQPLPPLPDLIPIKKNLINSNSSNCINNNNNLILKGDGGDDEKTTEFKISSSKLKQEVLWPQNPHETTEESSTNENNRKSNDRMKQKIKIEGEVAETKPQQQQQQPNNDDINIGKKTLRRRNPTINYNTSVNEFHFYGFYKPISRDDNKNIQEKKEVLSTTATKPPAKKTRFTREKIKLHRKVNRRRKQRKGFAERNKLKRSAVTKLKTNKKTSKITKKVNSASDTEEFAVSPRINPIFLWVKQDDTKIVEVRCEDYDKRNRIRLTKTPAGWRAIPRTEGLSPIASSENKDGDDDGDTENPSYQRKHKQKKKSKKKKKKKHRHSSPVTASPHRTTDNYHHNNNNNIPNNNNNCSNNINNNNNNNHHSDTDNLTIAQNQIELEKEQVEATSEIIEIPSNEVIDGEEEQQKQEEPPSPPHVQPYSNVIEDDDCIEDNIEAQIPVHTIVIDKSAQLPNNRNAFNNKNLNSNCSDSVSVTSENEHEFNNHQEQQHQQHNNKISESNICIEKPPPSSPLGAAPSPYYNHHHQLKSIKYDMEESGEDDVQLIPSIEEEQQHQQNQQLLQLQQLLLQQRKKDEKWNSSKSNGEMNANNASMCPDSVPVYDTFKEKSNCIQVTEVHTNNINGGINIKSLSDFSVDCHDLIEKIKEIQSANTEDLIGDHTTMLGADLLDSLIEQRCEDNHISGSTDAKEIIYTIADDYNDDDDILMEAQPVADIISRLGDSLSASPKCLSFNEAGEIEDLSGNLFDTQHNIISIDDDDNHIPNPFAQNTELHDLTLSIEDLTETNCEKNVPDRIDFSMSPSEKASANQQQQPTTTTSETISTNSSDDDNPKDLTCRKSTEQVITRTTTNTVAPQRPTSHCSEVQSPQPSGIPAVPPSPDLFAQNRTNSNDSQCTETITIPESPKRSFVQQKEPLNLGKCRKSASPTVSCSEEARTITKTKDICFDEPLQKRVKTEVIDESCEITSKPSQELPKRLTQSHDKSKTDNDPDALTQLRLLYNNPTWKVPDPLLVPKDRLNAVLASPAREIPLLLTTRPELRLPEAFAFPQILQDPNILVISLAQLEAILQKQDEITKAKAKLLNSSATTAAAATQSVEANKLKTTTTKSTTSNPTSLASGLAGDIDAATAAAFNQMLWLPYLGQMGQMGQMGQYGPDLLKAMMSMASQNMPDMMQFANQGSFPDFNPRQLEFALWQEAMSQMNTGSQNPARAMKINTEREFQKLANSGTTATLTERKPVINHEQHSARTMSHIPLTTQQKKMAQMMQQQNNTTITAQNLLSPNGTRMFNPLSMQVQANKMQQFGASEAKQTWQQQRKAQITKSELSAEQKKYQNSTTNAQSPYLSFPTSYQEFHEQQEKIRKEQLQLQQQQQQQMIREQLARSSQEEQKPRVQCKSLSNLLHHANKNSSGMFNPSNISKMSQLMAAPGIKQTTNTQSSNKQSNFSHQQQQQQMQQPQQQQQSQKHQNNQQQSPKLKVKPGLHLLDPTAQRRLLNLDDYSNLSSNTSGSTPSTMDESPDINSPLWHPLFGSAQKGNTNSYNSPWQWTTITAMGE